MIEFRSVEIALLTATEAARYLRLIDGGQDDASGPQRIDRLVAQGKVRPCLTGGRRCYAKRELDRFIDDETAGRVHPSKNGAAK